MKNMPVFIHFVLSCSQSLQFAKSMNIYRAAQCSRMLLQLKIEDDKVIICQIPQPANIIFRIAMIGNRGSLASLGIWNVALFLCGAPFNNTTKMALGETE